MISSLAEESEDEDGLDPTSIHDSVAVCCQCTFGVLIKRYGEDRLDNERS
jgi:hypothetical protein